MIFKITTVDYILTAVIIQQINTIKCNADPRLSVQYTLKFMYF